MNRCCARCKTPYNCGNRDCRCHPDNHTSAVSRLRGNQSQLRQEAAYAETHPTDGEAPQWTH